MLLSSSSELVTAGAFAREVLWLLLSMPYAILFAGQVLRPTMGSTGTGQEMLLGAHAFSTYFDVILTYF